MKESRFRPRRRGDGRGPAPQGPGAGPLRPPATVAAAMPAAAAPAAESPTAPAAPLRFAAVDLDRPGLSVLAGVDWTVGPGERWVVLGPNGSGKTTLFELASAYLHPTRGTVEILGGALGRVDVRRLRPRIGLVSSALVKKMVPTLTAVEVVMAGGRGALEPWWQVYGDDERDRARALIEAAGFGAVADRPVGHLSDGERQQVLLARALMANPELLLLDEPAAGLDMGGRERLVSYLGRLAGDPDHPATVMVTHHVEEIPPGFTHAMLLKAGRQVATGPLRQVLTAEHLSETFGLALFPECSDGRWTCRGR